MNTSYNTENLEKSQKKKSSLILKILNMLTFFMNKNSFINPSNPFKAGVAPSDKHPQQCRQVPLR